MAPQLDGRVVAGQGFPNVLQRLDTDGSIGPYFAIFGSVTVNGGPVNGVSVLPNGKILMMGDFTSLSGFGTQNRNRIARLTSGGGVEDTNSFKVNGGGASGRVRAMAIQPEGSILLGGEFQALNGNGGNFLGRLNFDGSTDTGFMPAVESYVYGLALQADRKILVCGQFLNVAGQPHKYLVRLNPNGTVDSNFNPGTGPDDYPYCMAVQADQKILVGGRFTTFNGVSRAAIVRLNSDGSVDSSFNAGIPGTFTSNPATVTSIGIQADGKILVNGDIYSINGQVTQSVARLSGIDGSVEPSSTFNFTGQGANESGIFLQGDGKILVGSQSTVVNSQSQSSMARLYNDAATQNLSLPDAGHLQWLRGGSAPETQWTTFEVSTDNGTFWNLIDFGTRIPGGWQVPVQGFPASGHVRARGWVVGGRNNASSAPVEQVLAFGSATTAPVVQDSYPTNIHNDFAVLYGVVNAMGSSTSVVFEYGPDTNYGSTLTPMSPVGGSDLVAVSALLNNLPVHSTWHFRVKLTNASGTTYGPDNTFTTTNTDATLSSLTTNTGTLTPTFDGNTISYTVSVPSDVSSFSLTSTTTDPNAAVQVNGSSVQTGGGTYWIPNLAFGDTAFTVVVSAQEPSYQKTYTITVTRASPLAATFNAATDVPITANGYTASGLIDLTLNFAPPAGTNLTVVNNTGLDFIQGRFSNLAQGQFVELFYNNAIYIFVANYYGGTGNDLVLQWANTRPVAWGQNSGGQLGNGGGFGAAPYSSVPVAVDVSGVLAGKTILSMATGNAHSLALLSDGTLASWGWGNDGQLGANTIYSDVPEAVDTSDALSGKTVVQIAVGSGHNLALCSDGTLVAWGDNSMGQVGTGSNQDVFLPFTVPMNGAFTGKKIVKIAAGGSHSLALCSDGTLVAWGNNDSGQLGRSGPDTNATPAVTPFTGALVGKTIVALAAGERHTLALCSDGSLVGWGDNGAGELGDNHPTGQKVIVPVAVSIAGTPLEGKTVVRIAAGRSHSLALCSDGTLAAWGSNTYGELGTGDNDPRSVPTAVTTSAALLNKTIVDISAEFFNSAALCSDGTMALWGFGQDGELANGATADSNVPVAMNLSYLTNGERVISPVGGHAMFFGMGIVAGPITPTAITLAATNVTSHSATLNSLVTGNGFPTEVTFAYGINGGTDSSAQGTPFVVSSGVGVNVSAELTNVLQAHTTYTFHVVAGGSNGSVTGSDLTFTTPNTAPIPFFNPPVFIVGHGGAFVPVLTTVYDADNDPLFIQSVTQGSHGSVTIVGNQVLYAADASFTTTDTFTYTVSDAFGGSCTQTATVCTTAIEKWRVTNFGVDAGNPAIAGDNADPNGNGIPNLVEYALGGDPVHNTSPGAGLVLGGGGLILNGGLIINPAARSILPVAGKSLTNTLQLSFTRYPSTGDVTLTVQAADTPAGPWTDLASSITGGTFQAIAVGSVVTDTSSSFIVGGRDVIVCDLYQLNDPAHPQRFMRLQVTRP